MKAYISVLAALAVCAAAAPAPQANGGETRAQFCQRSADAKSAICNRTNVQGEPEQARRNRCREAHQAEMKTCLAADPTLSESNCKAAAALVFEDCKKSPQENEPEPELRDRCTYKSKKALDACNAKCETAGNKAFTECKKDRIVGGKKGNTNEVCAKIRDDIRAGCNLPPFPKGPLDKPADNDNAGPGCIDPRSA